MRARALAVHMLACARAGPPATAPALSATRRQRRKVDKCRVADKKQTDKPTNKQTNTHCSFIGIDFKHVISQFPRRAQSEGWIARHVILSTALRVLLVSTTKNSTDYHHHEFHLQS